MPLASVANSGCAAPVADIPSKPTLQGNPNEETSLLDPADRLCRRCPTATFAAEKKANPHRRPRPPHPQRHPQPLRRWPSRSRSTPRFTTLDTAGKTFNPQEQGWEGSEVRDHSTTEIKNGKADAKFEDIKLGDWVSACG